MRFRDRVDAGQRLGRILAARPPAKDPLVLGIPRGGVVVAFEVAAILRAPLDIWLAHKIGAPFNPELAIGSVSIAGEAILDRRAIQMLDIPPGYIDSEIKRQRDEMLRRTAEYRGKRSSIQVAGKTVILVDDGVATGSTLFAAVHALRPLDPASLILAVPVAAAASCKRLTEDVDEMVILHCPDELDAVGQFYDDFSQVSDEEVIALMRKT